MTLTYVNGNIICDIGKADLTIFSGTCDKSFGAGLIKQIDDKYKLKSELDDCCNIGFSCVEKHKIGVLFLKELYTDKISYENILLSLISLRNYIVRHPIKSFAIPKIGGAHEKIRWDAFESMVNVLFADLDIDITIYCYDKRKV